MNNTTKDQVSTKGNWTEQKAKLKAKFPELTEADLHYEDGKKDQMIEKLQFKLGISRDELLRVISGI